MEEEIREGGREKGEREGGREKGEREGGREEERKGRRKGQHQSSSYTRIHSNYCCPTHTILITNMSHWVSVIAVRPTQF